MKLFNIIQKSSLLIIVLLTIACSDKPRGVLPEEKMQAVLWDLAMAGEYINGYVYYKEPSANRAVLNNELLKEIYKVHDITKAQFDKSLDYYKQHPKTLISMLDSIVAKHGSAPAAVPVIENLPSSISTPSIVR